MRPSPCCVAVYTAIEEENVNCWHRDVPVSYVVKRMAELSGLAVRYDEHAITVAPKELLPPEPDPAHLAAEAAAKARRPLLRETKKNE